MGIASITAILALRLEPTAKHVATLLAYHRNDTTGRCDPSVALLAQESGLCERTVQKHLGTLRDRGVIEITARAGRSSLYHVDLRSPCRDADHAGVHVDTPTPAPHTQTPALSAPKQEEQEGRASFSPHSIHPHGQGGIKTATEFDLLADRLVARQARLFAQGRSIMPEWTLLMAEHEERAVWAAIDALPPQQRWPSQVRHLLAPNELQPAPAWDLDAVAESLCESQQQATLPFQDSPYPQQALPQPPPSSPAIGSHCSIFDRDQTTPVPRRTETGTHGTHADGAPS